MRIAQVLLSNASHYERKSQRIDFAALSADHDVRVVEPDELRHVTSGVAHVYATAEVTAADVADLTIPFVATAPLRAPRWSWRKTPVPAAILTPFGDPPLPEAVEESFAPAAPPRADDGRKIIGSFARPETRNMVEQTLTRIHRFRDDVVWNLFDHAPSRGDLTGVDVWVDPAVDEGDLDGYVAEALVVGRPVVAARTPINQMRLEQGRTGWLVPPRDPNEMTHAILAALFKPEVAENKLAAARQTISKFRARQRVRLLSHLYETLSP